MIKSATFPYKTSLSKADVKTNWMGNTKWTYHKKRSFALPTFFWKLHLSIRRTSFKQLVECTSYPNIYINTFCKHLSFVRGCVFPVSTLKGQLKKIISESTGNFSILEVHSVLGAYIVKYLRWSFLQKQLQAENCSLFS